MSNYLVTDTDMTSVANAIRTKGGTSESLAFPTGFVNAINDIPSGGSVETKSVTSDYAWGNWCYVDANGVAQTFAPSGPGDGLNAVCPVGSLISVVSDFNATPSVTNATLVWSNTSTRDRYKWMGTFQVDS